MSNIYYSSGRYAHIFRPTGTGGKTQFAGQPSKHVITQIGDSHCTVEPQHLHIVYHACFGVLAHSLGLSYLLCATLGDLASVAMH